jgi:hypothetical protein
MKMENPNAGKVIDGHQKVVGRYRKLGRIAPAFEPLSD